MRRFGKVGWTAAIAGTLGFLVASEMLPWALIQWGMSPRAAAGHSMDVLLFVGPVGLLAGAAGGLLGQSLRLPGWSGALLLVAVPSVVNGFACGALAEGIAWARTRARVLFWLLVLGPALYWISLLAMLVFSRG